MSWLDARVGLVLPPYCSPSLPCCVGRAAQPLPPSSPGASGWSGGLAITWHPSCEPSPLPTSLLQPPPLPQTLDTRCQVGLGTCLASHLSCPESWRVLLSSACHLPMGLSSQGTAWRSPLLCLSPDGPQILLAWSCGASQSVSTSHRASHGPSSVLVLSHSALTMSLISS